MKKIRIGNDIRLAVDLRKQVLEGDDTFAIRQVSAYLVNTTKVAEYEAKLAERPKFEGRFPREPFTTVKLYLAIYKKAYVKPSGNQFKKHLIRKSLECFNGLFKKYINITTARIPSIIRFVTKSPDLTCCCAVSETPAVTPTAIAFIYIYKILPHYCH